MVASFLLALREGLEAALIIGIVLGILHKIDRNDLRTTVWRGVLAAAGLSIIAAFGLNTLGMEFEGQTEQIFEGVAMLLAAGILTWMIFWMHGQSSSIKNEIELKTSQAILHGGKNALMALAFLAVFREGIELALFLLAARIASNPIEVLSGAILGLAAAIVLGWILFTTTRKLNLKRFFQVTNILLIFFAAGLVGLGVHELNEAGWIPPIIEHVWDINPILNDKSEAGEILKTLFGYNGNPSLTEIIAYLGYFGVLFFSLSQKWFSPAVVQIYNP